MNEVVLLVLGAAAVIAAAVALFRFGRKSGAQETILKAKEKRVEETAKAVDVKDKIREEVDAADRDELLNRAGKWVRPQSGP